MVNLYQNIPAVPDIFCQSITSYLDNDKVRLERILSSMPCAKICLVVQEVPFHHLHLQISELQKEGCQHSSTETCVKHDKALKQYKCTVIRKSFFVFDNREPTFYLFHASMKTSVATLEWV